MSGLFGAFCEMAKGVNVGANGNGIFCGPCVGASPSLLPCGIVSTVVLALLLSGPSSCDGLSFYPHVLQPSADAKFETVLETLPVFAGETECSGQFNVFGEQVVVELGSGWVGGWVEEGGEWV